MRRDRRPASPLGTTVTNPVSGEQVPIWIADYVLMGYGTGAVMGVPAHDQRDFEFARAFGLPIIAGDPPEGEEAERSARRGRRQNAHEGVMVNSGAFDGTPARRGHRAGRSR